MKKQNYSIGIIGGAGHVGLPLSLLLATKGFPIKVIDNDEIKMDSIKKGNFPFSEEGGQELLQKVLKEHHIEFSPNIEEIQSCKIIIIAIGTPIDDHFNPDLSGIFELINTIKPFLNNDHVLILRSTLFPGTTKKIYDLLNSNSIRVGVSYCPERIAQGQALVEIETLPQIISSSDNKTDRYVKSIFSKITNNLVSLSFEEAELAKLFSNAWRYIKFSIANQFYMMSVEKGLDFFKIRDGMMEGYSRADDFPSSGFAAGPCLFKDTLQLGSYNRQRFFLGHSAMLINETLPDFLIDNYKKNGNKIKHKKIGILGMAFKPECDDHRDSLAYKLKKILEFEGAYVMCTDPYIHDPSFHSLELVLDSCKVIFIGSPHNIYKNIDFSNHTLIDCWGLNS